MNNKERLEELLTEFRNLDKENNPAKANALLRKMQLLSDNVPLSQLEEIEIGHGAPEIDPSVPTTAKQVSPDNTSEPTLPFETDQINFKR